MTLTKRTDTPGDAGVFTRHGPQRVAQLLAHGRVRKRLRLVAAPGVLQRRHLQSVLNHLQKRLLVYPSRCAKEAKLCREALQPEQDM